MKYQFCKPFEGDSNNDHFMTLTSNKSKCGSVIYNEKLKRFEALMCYDHINSNQSITRQIQIEHLEKFRSLDGPPGVDIESYLADLDES